MTRRMLARVAAAAVAAVAVSGPTSAADYPVKDIRMIVAWGAGGGTDGIVRKISSLAEKSLPKGIYVENIEGGLSATGVTEVIKARPDGYTLGSLTYDSVITVPWQGLVQGYSLDKLKLISRITAEPDAIMVAGNAPYKSFQDLIKAAKENPGKIKVGIQGVGSRVHIAMLQVQDKTGTTFNLISYPGGAAPQKEAILSGEVEAVITSLGDFAPMIEAKQVRGLVELSDARNAAYPDVPTAKEIGVDLQIGSFILLAAPAGTPDDVVKTVEKVYSDAYNTKDFKDWLAKAGVSPAWLGSDQVTAWAKDTQQQFFKIMQSLVDQGVLKKK
jgi:tripartite-type tricarboxylate transporter receptor subunit TctC